MIEFNKSDKYIGAALNSRALRQDLLSSNISNVDTPYYRSKDVDFETILAQKANQEFLGDSYQKKLDMAKTHNAHLDPIDSNFDKPTLFYRDGHMARNDGNTVDLDVEMSELSKNGVMYNALVEALRKNKSVIVATIDSSKNL